MDVPAGVTQEEGHTGFLIHLPSAVRALIFVARRIQPFLSLVDREVEFCVLTWMGRKHTHTHTHSCTLTLYTYTNCLVCTPKQKADTLHELFLD